MKDFLHGGDIYSYYKKYNIYPIDFSSNINPLGVPESVKKTYRDSVNSINIYPDISSIKLRNALAKYEDLTDVNIFAANGASDIIFKICYGLKPKTALLIAPTFSEYEKALTAVDCKINYHYLSELNSFNIDEKILSDIKNNDMFFLCNPNNPTGNIVNSNLLEKIIITCQKENCTLIIDECFEEFLDERVTAKSYLKKFHNIIIIRAFTKTFAIAGVRLGYLLTSNTTFIEKIKNASQSWSISTACEACGIAATYEKDYLKKSIKIIQIEKQFFITELETLSMKIFGSYANYIFFKSDIIDLSERLETLGILIRSCKNYHGLSSNFYRVAVRLHDDNMKLIEAIKKVKNG